MFLEEGFVEVSLYVSGRSFRLQCVYDLSLMDTVLSLLSVVSSRVLKRLKGSVKRGSSSLLKLYSETLEYEIEGLSASSM